MGKEQIDRPLLSPYNPLDKKNLGESIIGALLERSVVSLAIPESFIGAGIYALYYVGDFPAYQKIKKRNVNDSFLCPIYVGKAIPSGARKGGVGTGSDQGTVLYNRLNDHAKSIIAAKNLNLDDFFCRQMNVDDIWISLAESLLIEKFIPLWNVVIEGFGNHDPGGGRTGQQKSPWDTLHPGRKWAERLPPSRFSEIQLIDSINWHLNESC